MTWQRIIRRQLLKVKSCVTATEENSSSINREHIRGFLGRKKNAFVDVDISLSAQYAWFEKESVLPFKIMHCLILQVL